MRKWINYIDQQWYSECQIVAALNIYYYLTGKYIKPRSETYETLVEKYCAKAGSAIGIHRLYKELGLKKAGRYMNLFDLPRKGNNLVLPIEATIWHKRYGFHSLAIVGYEPKTDCIQVPNFRYETSSNGWMFLEDLKKFTHHTCGDSGINSKGKKWRFRLWKT